MKRLLFSTILILFSLTLPVFVSAQTTTENTIKEERRSQTEAFAGEEGADLEARDPRLIVAQIIQWGLGLVGTIALIYAIYGGYQIMTSSGNEEKLQKGKDTLFTAVIGIVVILSAYSITYFVSEYLLRSTQSQCDPDDVWCSRGRVEIQEETDPQSDPLGPPPREGGTVEEWQSGR